MSNKGKITENFTWEEAQHTNTNLNNVIMNEEIIKNVRQVAESIMQPLRNYLGKPINVTSWYRSPQVNKQVGGSSNSQHLLGEAVDFQCFNLLEAFDYIRTNLLFDQLIWEVKGDKRWVHVSYKRLGKNRNQVLVASYNKQIQKWSYSPYGKVKPIIRG